MEVAVNLDAKMHIFELIRGGNIDKYHEVIQLKANGLNFVKLKNSAGAPKGVKDAITSRKLYIKFEWSACSDLEVYVFNFFKHDPSIYSSGELDFERARKGLIWD